MPVLVALRGVGQVFFQENALTGALFVLGIALSSPLMAVGAVIGAIVGMAVARALQLGGHRVVRLVRRPPGAGEVRWDPAGGTIDAAGLEGVDGVVHLAGESIAEGRWTSARKRRIRNSRV